MKELKEGMVLQQETCDEILISLDGVSRRVNVHFEYWLIKDINSKYYILYNLNNQKEWKIEKSKMWLYFAENKKHNIKPIFKISDEVA